MATATQTETSPSTTPPTSDAPPAPPADQTDDRPSVSSVTKVLTDAGYVLDGLKITVENDPVPTEQAPGTPTDPGTNTQPQSRVSTSTTATLGFFNEDAPTLPEGKYKFRPLSQTEMDELLGYEETVRIGLPQFLAVALALLNIKKKKLWRLYARSFADYCDKRLGISRVWAYMQASAAEAMQNLLATGEQMTLPTTERQLRPLAGLDAKVQVAAWKLALAKAAGKKVTGKQVEEAVKEVSGDVVVGSDWIAKLRHQLISAGYETDFVQPVDVGEQEWIDFLHEPSEVYVKLIDEPSLSGMGICLAMREQDIRCQVVVNGAAVGKKKLTGRNDGTLERLLDPVLSVFIHTLGAFMERDGNLYAAGELAKDSTLDLKLANGDDTENLRRALQMQKAVQPAEARSAEKSPEQF